jgi:hypothetical protein
MLAGSKGRKLLSLVPRDRLLTESDGPFAQLEGQSLMPWNVANALDGIATIWGVSSDAVRKQVLSNLRNLGTLIRK